MTVDDSRGVGAQPPQGWLLRLISPLKILTKERGIRKLGDVMNYAQVDFVNDVEWQIINRGQVRTCVLKARQVGMSTIIEAIIFIMSMMLDDFGSVVMAHDTDSSEKLLSMTTRYWETYQAREFHQQRYQGKKHLAWSDSGSGVVVKTAGNENAGRSNTIHALHASEVAFWPEPETLMTSLRQAIPSFGMTMIFLESTANGIGNYFHTQCMDAMKGESEFTFKFYPWHEHPEYTALYLPPSERDKHALHRLSDEEVHIRRVYQLTDDQLIWRRWAIRNLSQGSIDKFHQEYPCDPHEAFISTGRNVFPLQELIMHYEPRKGARGILRRNDATRKVEFVPSSEGWLTVYSFPSADKSWGIYLTGADPTHTYAGDNACAQVLNRRTKEQVAVYRHKISPIPFGKHLQLLGQFYNQAMLAPENEGPGYGSVGVIVGDGYPNVYQRSDSVSVQGHPTNKAGWSTNSKSKGEAISHLLYHLTQPLIHTDEGTYGLLIHDELTMVELRNYVTSESGLGFENSDGSEYDDGVMALAIAVTVDDLEPPPPAYQVRAAHEQRRRPIRAVQTDDGGTGFSLAPEPEREAPDDPDAPAPAPAWEAWQVRTPTTPD